MTKNLLETLWTNERDFPCWHRRRLREQTSRALRARRPLAQALPQRTLPSLLFKQSVPLPLLLLTAALNIKDLLKNGIDI